MNKDLQFVTRCGPNLASKSNGAGTSGLSSSIRITWLPDPACALNIADETNSGTADSNNVTTFGTAPDRRGA